MSEPAAAGPAAAGTAAAAPAGAGAHRSVGRRWLAAALLVLVLVAAGIAVAVALSGPGAPTLAELGQRRAHLAFVAEGLLTADASVRRELHTARAAWPSIAHGLPAQPSHALIARAAAAAAAVEAVPSPPFVALLDELVGPAAGIAQLFRTSQLLARAAWQHVSAALLATAHRSTSAAFDRANAGVYIESVYQSVFDLSAIGKSLESNYIKLGGPQVFGARLTAARVKSIAATYSAAAPLEPHTVLPTP